MSVLLCRSILIMRIFLWRLSILVARMILCLNRSLLLMLILFNFFSFFNCILCSFSLFHSLLLFESWFTYTCTIFSDRAVASSRFDSRSVRILESVRLRVISTSSRILFSISSLRLIIMWILGIKYSRNRRFLLLWFLCICLWIGVLWSALCLLWFCRCVSFKLILYKFLRFFIDITLRLNFDALLA